MSLSTSHYPKIQIASCDWASGRSMKTIRYQEHDAIQSPISIAA
uniref:Uncharacterized protein n=2 Tax=Anguilla anguilla TaxID=7936 RepID=A0A0E9U515_ANGAN